MTVRTAVALLTAAFFWGCQQPHEVSLTPDPTASDFEVQPVVSPDSGLFIAPVDSAALLPEEQLQGGGRLMVAHVRRDGGRGITSFAYAYVFFSDTAVVDRFGRKLGFSGKDLGVVTLNGESMERAEHRLRFRLMSRDSMLARGWEYRKNLTGSYSPNAQYRWQSAPPDFGPVDVSVRSPDDLVVESPAGGSVVRRDSDLELQWRGGNGALHIVISTVDPVTGKTKPVTCLRVKANTGRAIIPSKLLRVLSPYHRYFVFTFMLTNRLDGIAVSGYASPVFAQAASVYNSYVELR